MKPIQFSRIFWPLLFGGALLLLVAVGAAIAQPTPPSTEPEGALAAADLAQPAVRASDGRYPDDNFAEGDLAGGAEAAATFSYYMVAGATLQPRSSINEIVYSSLGCSYMSSGSSASLISNTELQIPEGSVIKYLRVYYRDTNATGKVRGYLTRYAPGTGSVDLVFTESTDAFSGGSGFAVSSEITETVNNASYAYTLIGWPTLASSTLQICGLRVAYYPPPIWANFLPSVRR